MHVGPRCDARTHRLRTRRTRIRHRSVRRSDQRPTSDWVQLRPHPVSPVDTEVLAVYSGDLGGKLAVRDRTRRKPTRTSGSRSLREAHDSPASGPPTAVMARPSKYSQELRRRAIGEVVERDRPITEIRRLCKGWPTSSERSRSSRRPPLFCPGSRPPTQVSVASVAIRRVLETSSGAHGACRMWLALRRECEPIPPVHCRASHGRDGYLRGATSWP
jgi:hypothetical protein